VYPIKKSQTPGMGHKFYQILSQIEMLHGSYRT
jgi:hypothetical protein